MGLSSVLRGWLSESGNDPDPESPSAEESTEAVIYECRNCGTTVSADTTECPVCDSGAIAEYPIE